MRTVIPCFVLTLISSSGQELLIERAEQGHLRLKVQTEGQGWYRIEKADRLENWTIGLDSAIHGDELALDLARGEQGFFRLVPRAIPEWPLTVAVIGDSTAIGIERVARVKGWAEPLADRLGQDVRLLLAGEPGLSTKIFEDSRWPSVLSRTQPLLVLIQLGQIDQYTVAKERKGTTVSEYYQLLSEIVDFIRSWDGIPVLVTPLPWREFGAAGALLARLANRRDVMRQLALDKGVLLIDLHRSVSLAYSTASAEELSEWGPELDLFHLSPIGAERVATLTVEALPDPLGPLFFQGGASAQ